jgi:fucose permease
MTAGLPGTGVGGLFYMLSGILMPFREAYRAVRGKSDARSRRLVAYQTLMALGVVGGIWVTGWLLGLMISWAPAAAATLHGTSNAVTHASNVVRVMAFFIAFATLAVVLAAVQVARVVNACWVRIRHTPGAAGPWLERDAA